MEIPATLRAPDVASTVPEFMRSDPLIKAVAACMDTHIKAVAARASDLSTWDRVSRLPERDLDELAWELGVPWWRQDAGVEQKRLVLAAAPDLLNKLGTKYAVERVLSSYYTQCFVLEWWEYGGAPHHFKVVVQDLPTDLGELLRVLELVKRKSQWCDEVVKLDVVDAGVFVGAAVGVFDEIIVNFQEGE